MGDERSCNVIVGSGIDVIETGRLERELERASWQARQGIFTAAELHYLDNKKRPALLYAAFFAAKEATLKALAVEVLNLAHFSEIEILPDPSGNWSLNLHGRTLSRCKQLGVRRKHVAITPGKKFSSAAVVLES